MLLVPFPVDESPGAEDVEVEEEGNDITLRYLFTTYAPQYMYYHTIYSTCTIIYLFVMFTLPRRLLSPQIHSAHFNKKRCFNYTKCRADID